MQVQQAQQGHQAALPGTEGYQKNWRMVSELDAAPCLSQIHQCTVDVVLCCEEVPASSWWQARAAGRGLPSRSVRMRSVQFSQCTARSGLHKRARMCICLQN